MKRTPWKWTRNPDAPRVYVAYANGYRFAVERFDHGARLTYLTPGELNEWKRTGVRPYLYAPRRLGQSFDSVRAAQAYAPRLLKELRRDAAALSVQLEMDL